MTRQPTSLSSVDNALRLLHVLAQRPEVGVAEAGRLLGVARSTAHRLLTSLVVHGFAEQDTQTRVYRAGPALAQARPGTVRRFDARTHARPYLEAVAQVTGETVHLIVLAGGETSATIGAAAARTNGTNTAMVYGTDGGIVAADLQVLEDDKHDQPVYAPVPIIREAALKANPRIAEILKPLMQSFSGPTLQALNARVQINGESAESVAEDYLKSRGLLK